MEKKEVFVDISARHVHLTREDQDVLFGKGYELEVYKELAGGGGFASAEKIAVVGPRGSFPKVRILGPCRRQSQVELSKTDITDGKLVIGRKAALHREAACW